MLHVTVLGSGSRGNAVLIESQGTTILVDAGFNPRALTRRLQLAGKQPADIQALVLTHEHTDHACGAAAACARWTWPLYATRGTLDALPEAGAYPHNTLHAVAAQEPFTIGDFSILATPVPHDATEPVALVITDNRSGCRVGIATDLGHVPATLPEQFERLDVLVVESNHDERMLADGPYPWSLKRRVGSQVGHLSNRQAAAFIASCVHSGLRSVVLAHLSETNNTPELAVRDALAMLKKSGWRRDAVHAAHQTEIRGPYASNEMGARRLAVQLGFAF